MYRTPFLILFLWLFSLTLVAPPAAAETPLNLRLAPAAFSIAPDTVAPLAKAQPHETNKKESPQRWMIYAGIAGAFAVGLALSLSSDGSTHRQKIRVSWPALP